jgi:hypothetical protein
LCLRLGAVPGEEHVERLVLREHVAEDRIQRFHDGGVLGSDSGDLLSRRGAWGSHESAGVGVERVGIPYTDTVSAVANYGKSLGDDGLAAIAQI